MKKQTIQKMTRITLQVHTYPHTYTFLMFCKSSVLTSICFLSEISADPQTYEEPQIESSLKREDQSSLHTAGGGMEVKHRRIQSDTLVETILEGGAMSRGMSTDSDLEGVPDSTPATHIGSCVIS